MQLAYTNGERRPASGRSDTLWDMTTARSSQVPAVDAAAVAWERRRKAAWIDYLRVVRESARGEYESAEGNAWETLQRRLRRNDELRTEQLAVRA